MMAMATGGTLHVTLVSATLLPSCSGQDPADSYATLICGKQQFTTRTAKDQGTLPTWNETHAFEVEDRDEFGSHGLVIEIFAARPELNELLGITKLPACKVFPANEETSLYVLSRPSEGECGQVKVKLKWDSHIVTTTTQPAPMYSGYEEIQPSAPMYPSAGTQPSAPVQPLEDPVESYYGEQLYGDVTTPADAAASALAGLALNKDKQHINESSQTSHQDGPILTSNFAHQHADVQLPYAADPHLPKTRESNPHQPPEIDTFSVNGSDTYPSYSTDIAGHYPPQGFPYLASPIGGVVTSGPNYDSPAPVYTAPPFETASKLKESESIAQGYGLPANAYPESNHHYPPSPTTYTPSPSSGDLPADKSKEKVSEVPFETPFYSGAPISQVESYSPVYQSHATNTGNHSYSGFSQYGAPLPAPSETYPPAASSYPRSAGFTNKAQNSTHQEPGVPAQYGVSAYAGVYTPESNVGYSPSSSFPSPGQYDHGAPQSAGYPGQENIKGGKDKTKLGMNASSQLTCEGETQDKGFHGYQYGHSPEGYAQPFYPSAPYPQYGYPPQNLPHGYPAQGYPPQYAAQQGFGGLHSPYGHQVGYGVAPTYYGYQQQHGHYHHQQHGGHGGHHEGHGGHYGGHKGGHGFGQHGYGGHKSGHGSYGHNGSHGHGHYGHQGGHHSHHEHH